MIFLATEQRRILFSILTYKIAHGYEILPR
jgi:hypothetical protein